MRKYNAKQKSDNALKVTRMQKKKSHIQRQKREANLNITLIGILNGYRHVFYLWLRGCSMATSVLHSQNFRFQITIYVEEN
jgi:hypothetical protein